MAKRSQNLNFSTSQTIDKFYGRVGEYFSDFQLYFSVTTYLKHKKVIVSYIKNYYFYKS